LSAPSGSGELVVLEHFSEFFLVKVGLETNDFFKELHGVSALLLRSFDYGLPDLAVGLLDATPFG
jgi:hypothetical protein